MVKQARAVATRQQILMGAAEAFEQKGFEGSTLGSIVEIAGTTKGALYFHFKSKEELAQAIISAQHGISIATVEAIAATGNSALEQMVMLSYEIGRQIVHDPVVRAGIRLTLELSAVAGPPEPYLGWIAAFEMLAERASADGDLLGTIEPAVLARFGIGAFTGVQLVSNVLTGRVDLVQRLDEMWELLLPGIVPVGRHEKIARIRHARWSTVAAS
ncbi:MAG: ScbR family autoregulator-binding transcription factor [Rhodococcus sp. (in: high G+C Gram-positive bacteria)]|uniref:ScbR family autoregulator-binding transcription factor n=1 Tax=Rhodococcus sp. TaxID=1831 RepID=UPI003BB6CBF1